MKINYNGFDGFEGEEKGRQTCEPPSSHFRPQLRRKGQLARILQASMLGSILRKVCVKGCPQIRLRQCCLSATAGKGGRESLDPKIRQVVTVRKL